MIYLRTVQSRSWKKWKSGSTAISCMKSTALPVASCTGGVEALLRTVGVEAMLSLLRRFHTCGAMVYPASINSSEDFALVASHGFRVAAACLHRWTPLSLLCSEAASRQLLRCAGLAHTAPCDCAGTFEDAGNITACTAAPALRCKADSVGGIRPTASATERGKFGRQTSSGTARRYVPLPGQASLGTGPHRES